MVLVVVLVVVVVAKKRSKGFTMVTSRYLTYSSQGSVPLGGWARVTACALPIWV